VKVLEFLIEVVENGRLVATSGPGSSPPAVRAGESSA